VVVAVASSKQVAMDIAYSDMERPVLVLQLAAVGRGRECPPSLGRCFWREE